MCVAAPSCNKASTCFAQVEALVVFHVYRSRLLMTHIGNNTNRQYTNHYELAHWWTIHKLHRQYTNHIDNTQIT